MNKTNLIWITLASIWLTIELVLVIGPSFSNALLEDRLFGGKSFFWWYKVLENVVIELGVRLLVVWAFFWFSHKVITVTKVTRGKENK